jgi:probable selenium-dependent hydroxylase accessory protein YqeC
MDLAAALGLGDRELVSFVGAGGKKTSMAKLVAEGQSSHRVGYTTTTHMPPPAFPLLVAEPSVIADRLETASPPVAFASERVENPARVDAKVKGFDPASVDRLFAADLLDWIVVKADGARMREFKAPGDGEPAIPQASTVVVPVASAKVFGTPLDESGVHRPERVAAIADVSLGTTITPALVGQVLAFPAGGLKGVPDGARVVPMINKADDDAEREQARDALRVAFDRADRFTMGLVSSFEAGFLEALGH